MIRYEKRDGRFELPRQRGEASFREIMKWQLSGSRSKWPSHVPNKAYPPPPARVEGDQIAATWIGHSTVLLQTAGLNILTDPFFSRRASPTQLIGPARVRNPGVALADLPPLDLILLSHSHYDHLDKPALRWLARHHKAKLVTPLNNARHARGHDVVELDWHEGHAHAHLKVTALPALHWSKRTIGDTNKSLWGAFMLEGPMGAIYFGADTGFGQGQTFREAKAHFGAPRLALLPIGAYEPRWFMAPQHMNPEEAVQAHQLLGAKTSLAIHHGTIQLTDEPIGAPVAALDEALAATGLTRQDFRVADIGETVIID
ncbi:MAG: MBL fold metallo-hydrolase [Alphaproteobacteria bacterium]|nr:MBL fold metallo-hydrolase [Alphaproteobacteria bacterium]